MNKKRYKYDRSLWLIAFIFYEENGIKEIWYSSSLMQPYVFIDSEKIPIIPEIERVKIECASSLMKKKGIFVNESEIFYKIRLIEPYTGQIIK